MARYESCLDDQDFKIDERNVGRVPIHWHSFYEAEFCLSGEGTQYINGVPDKMEKGVLTFLSPKDFHRVELEHGPLHFFTFAFYSHMLSSNMINIINESKPPFRLKLEGESYGRMLSEYRALEKEYLSADTFRERAIKYRLALICLDIIRLALEARDERDHADFISKENKTFTLIIEDIIPYINVHYSEHLTRDQMAERLHISPTHFSEMFKKRLGISFTDYVTRVRMTEAMQMLKYTDKSVYEIMNDVGYNSSSAFYEKFKECHHMLPGDVKRYQQEKE